MKTILLIDDLRVFKPDFDLTGMEVHIARTSKEALTLLQDNPEKEWDEIWFDHDLGMVDGKEDTTLPVVDYLALQTFEGNRITVRTAYIHTSNSAGARDLTTPLQRWGYKTVRVEAERIFNIDGELYWAAQGRGR